MSVHGGFDIAANVNRAGKSLLFLFCAESGSRLLVDGSLGNLVCQLFCPDLLPLILDEVVQIVHSGGRSLILYFRFLIRHLDLSP